MWVLEACVSSTQQGMERVGVRVCHLSLFASGYLLVPIYISVTGLVRVPCDDGDVVVSCQVRNHAYCPSRLVCFVVLGRWWCAAVVPCLLACRFGGWALIAGAQDNSLFTVRATDTGPLVLHCLQSG